MLNWSKRGQGSCPKCQFPYFNRRKPQNCSNCGYELGGSVPAKVQKLSCPSAVRVHEELFSVRTSSRDDRCFVLKEGNFWICLHPECKNVRAMYVSSDRPAEFVCSHVKLVSESPPGSKCVGVSGRFCLNAEKIASDPSDSETKELLKSLVIPVGYYAAYKVTDKTYVVYGPPTSTNTLGFCHVKVQSGNVASFHKCTCKGFVSKGKQEKSRSLCVHLHVLFCCLELSSRPLSPSSSTPHCSTPSSSASASPDTPQPGDGTSTSTISTSPNTQHPEDGPSTSRMSTLNLYSLQKIPYSFPPDQLKAMNIKDAGTFLGTSQGWPSLFVVEDDMCRLCGSPLGAAKLHPGTRGGSVIYSNLNPFKEVVVKVKECCSSACKAMHRVFPTEEGLFNISDKILVAIDILLEWRELFKRGCPVSNFVEAKTQQLVLKLNKDQCPSSEKLNYFNELLYNGFWCFELITERVFSSGVCGICGIIGEVYLGDGNEKNCCSNSKIIYPSDGATTKEVTSLEEFLSKVKMHFIEKVIYTKAEKDLIVYSEELPPVIAPVLRGSVITNTEHQKKSVYLKNTKTSGDPAALHKEIKEKNINMAKLNEYDVEVLKELASHCQIPVSAKSKAKLCADIQALYSSMLVGLTPCHGFSKVPGHTGGFYHLVCRHGCTVASKFLTLTESVRDAADLYTSLKYPPVVFICDSPCGFVRHLECRDPVYCDFLWGENSGCFERPEYAKRPSQNVDCPMIVPTEYRSSSFLKDPEELGNLEHPVSGSSRRFVLGDRFHNTSKPHKSPLCLFHDIDLCMQSNTIKTSYQESENDRKNMKLLRSSTLQGFGLHFCFNYLMDFYQNEAIVKQQQHKLSQHLQEGQKLVRDKYHRYAIIDECGAAALSC